MYLLFIDESGTPPKPDKAKGKYFVLGGVIIPEGAWHPISNELNKLKSKYGVSGEVKWKFFGAGNSDTRNNLRHLTVAAKDQFRKDIYSILTSRKSVKIISCVTAVEAAYAMPSVKTQNCVYHLTYKGVTERFQYFLQDASRVTSQTQLGLVVCDHRMKDDDGKLRGHHHRLVEEDATNISRYENLVETVFFSPSDISIGLQFADMVAGAVFRAYQYGENRFASMIKPSFRTSAQGMIAGYGLVKMPKESFIEPSGGEAEASPTH